ncbi:hypothetical protein [Ornithinimicrobium murale]|uniref:hypothetical protein n=1 Tax=Ornithinimicrobium murale TaxID=1050153 RepID=UPI000E0DC817|nr:hypothetical protein [Ornithinimicrobium murale]
MPESLRSDAVQLATGATSEKGVSFGDLEARLGRDVPSVRGRARGERVVRAVRLITHAAPVLAALAPLGTPGPLGIARPGLVPWMVYGESLEWLALVCFVLALSGQTWTLLTWWHLGRHRDLAGFTSSVVALLVGVLWLVWLAPSPSIGGVLPDVVKAPVLATVVLAAVSVGAQLFASRPGTLQEARAQARGGLMRVLPPEEQQSLLAERHEVLEVLLTRQLLDRATADQAASLPLGDWWVLDVDEPRRPAHGDTPGGTARRCPASSLANSNMALRCLKAVALVAPFGMMLLPIGNPGISGTGGGMRSVMESDGFSGDTLVTMALLCAMAGVIGQVWTLFDWWRLGRRRDGLWLAWSWTALGSAVVTLVIFPFFITGSWGMQVLTGPILAVATSAAVSLVLLYAASVPGTVQELRKAGQAEDLANGFSAPSPS